MRKRAKPNQLLHKVRYLLYEAENPLTAREVACKMYELQEIRRPDRTLIQPRLTDLLASGDVETAGKKWDIHTHRNVTLYRLSDHTRNYMKMRRL